MLSSDEDRLFELFNFFCYYVHYSQSDAIQTIKERRRNGGEEVTYAYIFAGKKFNFRIMTNNLYLSSKRSTLLSVWTKDWRISVSQYGRLNEKNPVRCYASYDNWPGIEQDLMMLKLAGILTFD